MRLILASASPRRRELMTAAGYTFEVSVSSADEDLSPDTPPAEGVRILAERKAGAVAKTIGDTTGQTFVVGADTLVELDGVPLGKPKDEADAKRMLSALSGSRHRVVTGVAVIAGDKCFSGTETTVVSFRSLSDSEISDYVATGEPMDKAGAYAIQGGAEKFVSGLDGELDNVIGLPCKLLARLLSRAGYDPDRKEPT